jgi:adenosylmethionine-8-amino-7-oxononanoate aminotransferase
MLFISDEVINGLGRTGKWFGIQHWGVHPDIMILAKGLSSGYTPIAALLISSEISWVFEEKKAKFLHGHTLAGNPVSCAVALSVLDIIENDRLVERSENLGAYLHQKAKDTLAKNTIVGDIRGRGLLLGIELVKDKKTKEPFEPSVGIEAQIHQKAIQKGCLIYTGNGTFDGVSGAHLLVAPPFIITKVEIDTALQILDEAIGKIGEEFSAASRH